MKNGPDDMRKPLDVSKNRNIDAVLANTHKDMTKRGRKAIGFKSSGIAARTASLIVNALSPAVEDHQDLTLAVNLINGWLGRPSVAPLIQIASCKFCGRIFPVSSQDYAFAKAHNGSVCGDPRCRLKLTNEAKLRYKVRLKKAKADSRLVAGSAAELTEIGTSATGRARP